MNSENSRRGELVYVGQANRDRLERIAQNLGKVEVQLVRAIEFAITCAEKDLGISENLDAPAPTGKSVPGRQEGGV